MATVGLLGMTIALVLLAIGGAARRDREAAPPIAVVGATLIAGTGSPPVREAVVVMRDGRFACAGPRSTCEVPSDARVIDGTGRWLLPGLIDTHVHLAWTVDSAWTARAQALRFAAGITTVREMGTLGQEEANSAAARAATSTAPTPRIYLSGRVDAVDRRRHRARTYSELTAELIDAGVNGIKIKGPIGTAAVAEVLAVAEDRRVNVYAHAGHAGGSLAELELAIREGLDGVVHATTFGSFIRHPEGRTSTAPPGPGTPPGWVADWANIDQKLADHLMRLMIDSDVWLEPTLESAHLLVFPAEANDAEARWHVQPPQAAALRADTLATASRDDGAASLAGMEEFVRRFHEAGGTVVTGSDESALPGWAYHEELYMLVKAGFTPMEALTAATSDAARVLGWSDRLGTIESGKMADMVMLDGDPLADIRHTRLVRRVFKSGVEYEVDRLKSSAARALR
jgi:imidazolonepropionase-like amidohydrolase